MRIWHKDLIPVLPRQQLIAQWRELCCIAKNIHDKGTPNHLLVNKVLEYPLSHFFVYSKMVYAEMLKRGYNCDWTKFSKYVFWQSGNLPDETDLFAEWHNERYFLQCFYNLQEKYDCGGISYQEWMQIGKAMQRLAFRMYMERMKDNNI